jgi:hypothetical protein
LVSGCKGIKINLASVSMDVKKIFQSVVRFFIDSKRGGYNMSSLRRGCLERVNSILMKPIFSFPIELPHTNLK